MIRTVEATIDEQGNVRLLEPVKLGSSSTPRNSPDYSKCPNLPSTDQPEVVYYGHGGEQMIRTVEATIDEQGNVRLLEPVKLGSTRRALVTILEDAPARTGE